MNKKYIRRNFLIPCFSRDYGDSDRFAAINILVAGLRFFFVAMPCFAVFYHTTVHVQPQECHETEAISVQFVVVASIIPLSSKSYRSFARHFSNLYLSLLRRNAITNVIVRRVYRRIFYFLTRYSISYISLRLSRSVVLSFPSSLRANFYLTRPRSQPQLLPVSDRFLAC